MKKNIAVIGCGYWGKNLARCFSELGVLGMVCDVNAEHLRKAQLGFVIPELTRSVDDVLNNKNIDAVVIATPASAHYEVSKKALLAGKDVFVEKPLALDLNQGRELVELAANAGRILMVGHVLNYHSAVCELKRLVSTGSLGRLRYIYSNRLSFGKIRREENILWSFAPHDISMILSLIGASPVEVSSKGSNFLHPGIADVTLSTLKFDNGVDAHIFVSWLHPFKEQKLVVIGEERMAVFDDTAPWGEKLLVYPHQVVWHDGIPEAKKAEGEKIDVLKVEPLKEECKHFLECISTRSKPMTDGTEGISVLGVLHSLQESLNKNGASVSIKAKTPDYFVHETAIVENGAKVSKGAKIWHFSHVMGGAEIGEGSSLGQNVVMMSGSKLGKNVKVQNNVSVYEKVIVEDDAFLGPSMVFTNVINPRSHVSRKHEYLPTYIRKGATIGANATIVCGNEIGEYAFIGSGAVVTKDVSPYALMYGNPARQHGWMCRCGVKLNFDGEKTIDQTTCKTCGALYEKNNNNVVWKG